jgi:hypothetical protein
MRGFEHFDFQQILHKTQNEIKMQLSSLTECSVCTETYNNPRILPCVHTYCGCNFKSSSYKNFIYGKLPGDQVPCPTCRKVFSIRDNGVNSLPWPHSLLPRPSASSSGFLRITPRCRVWSTARRPPVVLAVPIFPPTSQ